MAFRTSVSLESNSPVKTRSRRSNVKGDFGVNDENSEGNENIRLGNNSVEQQEGEKKPLRKSSRRKSAIPVSKLKPLSSYDLDFTTPAKKAAPKQRVTRSAKKGKLAPAVDNVVYDEPKLTIAPMEPEPQVEEEPVQKPLRRSRRKSSAAKNSPSPPAEEEQENEVVAPQQPVEEQNVEPKRMTRTPRKKSKKSQEETQENEQQQSLPAKKLNKAVEKQTIPVPETPVVQSKVKAVTKPTVEATLDPLRTRNDDESEEFQGPFQLIVSNIHQGPVRASKVSPLTVTPLPEPQRATRVGPAFIGPAPILSPVPEGNVRQQYEALDFDDGDSDLEDDEFTATFQVCIWCVVCG